MLGFAEEDAGGAGFAVEGGFELDGVGDLGDVGAAGLLGGFEGDATPALGSLWRGEGEVFFGAAGEDGGDAGYAEFGGLFDGPLEVVELEDGEEEVEGKGGVGFELFVEGEVDLRFGDGRDFGSVEEAVGDDVVDLAGLGAQNAAEVGGLVAGEGGGGGSGGCGGGPGVGDPAAAGHGSYGFMGLLVRGRPSVARAAISLLAAGFVRKRRWGSLRWRARCERSGFPDGRDRR